MDFSNTIKSFKSHGSFNSRNKISAGGSSDDITIEQLPILSDHDHSPMNPSDDHREVIVKIDGGDHDDSDSPTGFWRESSYEFWTDKDRRGGGGSSRSDGFKFRPNATDHRPPSNVSRQFSSNQHKDNSGEMSLDMDLEMDELNHRGHNLPPEPENERISKDLKVSFQIPATNMIDIQPERTTSSSSSSEDEIEEDPNDDTISGHYPRRRSSNVNANINVGADEVLKCTSFQTRAGILRTKTQSRLIDPPMPDRRSDRVAKSGQLKSGRSGMLEKVPAVDDDDDETFIDEDVQDNFKKGKLDALTLLQWISLILIVTALVCTLVISRWKKFKLRGLELWKWEVLVLVLICGRLVSGWGIRIVVFLIERNFMLRKRVLYFVYGVRKAVQNCIWLGLVLIAWQYLFDTKVERDNKFLRFVNKFMWCMLAATLIWLVKTLMVKVLASSFHVSTFFDRIQDSLFNQYVIEMLSGPPVIEILNNHDEEERLANEITKLQNAGATLPPDLKSTVFKSRSGKGFSNMSRGVSIKKHSGLLATGSKKHYDTTITIDHLHKLNPKNISAWNMKRLIKIVRHGCLSTLDEQLNKDTSMHEDESSKQILSEYEAKIAARKIFRNVSRPRFKYIYMQDLLRFLRGDESIKAMTILQGSSEYERISKTDLKNWVVNAFRERRALALTLNDTKTAVDKLHHMVNVLVGVIIVVICLVILGLTSSQFLLAVGSQIVVVTFIFGNTCKTIFEAIIFLFVMHPFDVGDRCEIGGVQMVVEEMNILTTVFLRFDSLKVVYPNSALSTIPIYNFYRSPDMDDTIEFCVHIATPTEKVNLMKQRIISYIENKKEHWYSNPLFVTRNIEYLHMIQLSMWPTHKMNFQNVVERWNRRALLVQEIIKIVKELDIEYRLYPIDINIRDMPTVNSARMPSTWTTPAAP